MPFFSLLSAHDAVHVTQALYKYRPASVWALCRLVIADYVDRTIALDIRAALWLGFGIKRKSDETRESEDALKAVEEMMAMFEGVEPDGDNTF